MKGYIPKQEEDRKKRKKNIINKKVHHLNHYMIAEALNIKIEMGEGTD
jgi:hypothetical protein